MRLTFLLSLLTLTTIGANAHEKVVESISDGSCWLDTDLTRGIVKIASFNDAKSYQINSLFMNKVSSLLKENLRTDDFRPSKFNVNLHCGAYGSSVVLNFIHDKKGYCSWINPSDNKLKIRSFGQNSEQSSRECDGYKVGEYLIAISSDSLLQEEFLNLLSNEKYSHVIKRYEIISSRYIKVEVKENLEDKEFEFIKEIKLHRSVTRVERNNFYHPIGDFKVLDLFSIE